MPELPEVQTIVNELKNRVCGLTVVDFWTDTPKIIKRPPMAEFKKTVKGLMIVDVQRRGKNVAFYFQPRKGKSDKVYIMLAHQKMTGHFLVGKWNVKKSGGKYVITPETKGPISSDKYNSYIRMIFYLNNGTQLGLSDLRKFARIIFGLASRIEDSDEIKQLGPDALSREFDANHLYPILQKRSKAIKPILLEQKVASGVGNIYGDEALFVAKINPLQKSKTLGKKDVARLVEAIKKVLKKSLKLRGTSASDYRDTYGQKGSYDKVRYVYNREGLPCRVCKAPIKRIKIGQRSSHFCPHCQPLRSARG
jgi:formamidopyrimidine-DNA glycosylase